MFAAILSAWLHLSGPGGCVPPAPTAEVAPMPRPVPVMRTLPVGPPRNARPWVPPADRR